ncbi:helix-turn-helix domain-containing protein [Actinoplanes sp. CA-054009]
MSDDRMSASTFLVAELRRARSAAGLSQDDLGKAINYSSSRVSAVENGQRPPTKDYLAGVDRALDTGGLFERLSSELVSIDHAPVWLRDWVIFEREATLIRWFEPMVVPGLLQTEPYARAVLETGGLLSSGEVERSVASRLERQAILDRPEPPQFVGIIDEAVLRRRVGTPSVMVDQCDHLLTALGRPQVQLHVVPMEAGHHAGLAGPFILAKGRDFEAAHLDNSLQATIVDRRDAVDTLGRKWEAIRGEALPRAQSRELIKDVATKWQT